MKVAVLGASGRAGSEVAKEIARRGHQVLGVARRPTAIPSANGITAIASDASDSVALAGSIDGCEAVVSALHFDVPAAALLSALRRANIKRLLVTGGAAGLEASPGKRVIDDPAFPEDWKDQALKGIAFLAELRDETDIDWTFFSPAAMLVEGPRLGRYRLGMDQLVTDENGNSTISFADFAIAMADELEQGQHSRTRFTAAY
ncbi:NAD(P)-dependent oxidoreductase [Variovorax paradoxus]|uniref:NAD(P)-dependent oxidoreductase n=1 Tax=Variovorax paradoxus TaxID=34073 RepID=UPI003ECF7EEB